MPYLRRKIWVALLFALITIGQGFALSYVFNLPNFHKLEMSEKQGPIPSYLLFCGNDLNDSLRENPTPHQKSHHELLSLRSDPFLPSCFSAVPVIFTSIQLFDLPLPSVEGFDPSFDKPPQYFS